MPMRAPTETSGTPLDSLTTSIARRGLSRAPMVAAALATAASVHAQVAIHVDDDAPPGGDGRSWSTAFGSLQIALDQARYSVGPAIIKIAGGVYTPHATDRARSFDLASGITLIGGFAGRNAPQPDLNNPVVFETILSGDLARDDGPNWTNRGDNSLRVLSVASAAVMNLTISGGSGGPDAPGGAIFGRNFQGSDIELDHCRVVDNESVGSGVVDGWNSRVGLIARDTLFQDNRGLGVIGAADVRWQRCRILDNRAPSGSLLRCRRLIADNCLIAGNRVLGEVFYVYQALQMRSCTLVANRSGRGQLMDITTTSGDPSFLHDTIIHPGPGPCTPFAIGTTTCQHIYIWGSEPSLSIRRNCLAGGAAIFGPWFNRDNYKPSNVDTDPLFTDPFGPDGDPLTAADNDYHLRPTSPCIDTGWTVSTVPELDLDGQPRRVSATCGAAFPMDIGAYEVQGADCPQPSVRVFVNVTAPAGGDGLTWATAKRDLYEALGVCGVAEVWLASGRYSASFGREDPAETILLDRDVIIRGGFNGTETSANQRLPNILSTIDGQLADGTTNSHSVLTVRGQHVDIDRLFVTNGQAETASGGFECNGGGTRVLGGGLNARDCIWSANSAVQGGNIFADRGSVALYNCSLWYGQAIGTPEQSQSGGGAIAARESAISIEDCRFDGNWAAGPAPMGGAIYVDGKCTLSALRSVFVRNSATIIDGSTGAGGAIHALADSQIVSCGFFGNWVRAIGDGRISGGAALLSDCHIVGSVFSGNYVSASRLAGSAFGGAIYSAPGVAISNCSFASNSATALQALGGAIYSASTASIPLTNSILWNNSASSASSTPSLGGSMLSRGQISRCIIQGWTPNLAGTNTHGWDPRFTNPVGPDVIPGTEDDDLSLRPNSPAIDFGDSAALPPDTLDLDFDRNLSEPISRDYLGRPRQIDDVGFIDSGTGPTTFLDLGAIEFDRFSCRADTDGDASVTVGDLFFFLTDFFLRSPPADFNRSGAVTVQDLLDFIEAFVNGCP